jgi:hypothetical protein
MYNEMKNFAQTLHDENNLNVTFINYKLRDEEHTKNYKRYRLALRIYNNNAVLPSTPIFKFLRFIVDLEIITFENFFNDEKNNTNLDSNNLNNNLTVINNANVNYINILDDSNNNNNNNNINNLNNFNYSNIPIAIAEIV